MKPELTNLLCEYLGELMNAGENCFDWTQKDKIIRKINAVNVLLGIPERRETTMQKLQKIVNEYKTTL